jgi:GNAT superfamily N-acetyltransferase
MRLHEISDERLQDYLHRAGKRVDSRLERIAQARQRLSKGYEIYHADRPTNGTAIVDRFDADTPALARQYYEKFIRDYVSDVDFDLRLRRATGIMEYAERPSELINKTANVDGILVSINTNKTSASVYATANGRRLGYAEFDRDGNILVPYDLAVDDKYRGQGIAAVMYDYAKSLGFTIRASADQTDDGKYFWKKNRGNKRVWESKTLDPEVYGEMLPTATVKRIVTSIMNQVDPSTKVTVKQSPEGYYIVRGEKLRLDFGITADGGDINANIVNAYSSYKGKNVVTEIFGQCFRAAEQLWGKPSRFVMSAHEDRGHGVWQHMAQKLGAEWEGSINEIAKIPQGDFGDADTLRAPEYDIEKKPLPGGSGFTYAVGKTGTGDIEIMIFDGNTLAAELDLFETQDVTGAWRVETVAVNPQYRNKGLGKALYGIALSILRLTLEAGDTQTKHGQRMWLMLNSIPGVEVMGYNMEPTNKYKAHKGDNIIAQDKQWTRYTFPVAPGKQSMRSRRPGTGVYSSQASMIAKWTGQ